MKKFAIVTISVLALALTPGCDSDGGGSGSNSDSDAGTTGTNPGTDAGTGGTGGAVGAGFTGLDGELALSDLTDEQQIAACEAGTAYMSANMDADAMKQAGCKMSGMFAGMMGITCQEAVDACMADDEPMEEEDCSEAVDDLSGCTEVTVAETEACMMAQWTQQTEALAALAAMTCDEIEAAAASGEGEGMMEEPEEPAECEGLEDKCPAFFAADDDM